MSDDPVIVIGSGPCGALAAARLVERGLDVLMLDAGIRAPKGIVVRAAGNTLYRRMGRDDLADDRKAPSSDPDVDWISSLSLGGLSNYWTAAVPRFASEDFTDGARVDDRYRWPVTYDELVPYYEVAERALTVTAGDPIDRVPSNVTRFTHRLPAEWRDVVDAAGRAGHALGVLPMAKGRPWTVLRRGTEFSSYQCVVVPLLASPRFRLIPGAHVSRLSWSASAGQVDSVDYVDRRSGQMVTVRCRAVVVAAGAIDSTVVLLRSRSADFPRGLGNTNGLVGRYLHDHPRQWWPAEPSSLLPALSHPVYVARAAYEGAAPLLATSFTLGLAGRLERLRTYYRGRSKRIGVQVFGTMVPTPDLGVELRGGVDTDPAQSRPTISLRYDEAAVRNMSAGPDRLRAILHDAGIAVDIPGPFHELRPGNSVHYGGSVRMHADAQFGVLDRWNRVHDVPNVVVADSSCFTTGPEKNPTLTAMALATRAADRLAGDLTSGSLG